LSDLVKDDMENIAERPSRGARRCSEVLARVLEVVEILYLRVVEGSRGYICGSFSIFSGVRAVLRPPVRSAEGVVRCCTEVLRCLMDDVVRAVRGGARGAVRVLLAVNERRRALSGW
jgi:hypothetical protein